MTEFQTPPDPANIVRCNGRVYDLTALETPPALLPAPVQDALLAWPHGWVQLVDDRWGNCRQPLRKSVLVSRAKPAPVVKSYDLHWAPAYAATLSRGGIDTHRIIVTGPDGGPYTATVEALE